MIYETKRLYAREMTGHDLPALKRMLQDPVVMAAYEHAFSDEESQEWLLRQQERYRRDGFGLWALMEKESGEMVGQCGLTLQSLGDDARGADTGLLVPEIGYLLVRDAWQHRGYATEAARGCKRLAFDTLGLPEVFSIIRDTNIASMNVAIRNGMTVRGRMIKHYYGMDMPHLVFAVKNHHR